MNWWSRGTWCSSTSPASATCSQFRVHLCSWYWLFSLFIFEVLIVLSIHVRGTNWHGPFMCLVLIYDRAVQRLVVNPHFGQVAGRLRYLPASHPIWERCLLSRGATRAEDARETHNQSHISPIILVYEDKAGVCGSLLRVVKQVCGNAHGQPPIDLNCCRTRACPWTDFWRKERIPPCGNQSSLRKELI